MDERREEREELAAIDREQLAAQAEERAYWQDEGLEHAERVTRLSFQIGRLGMRWEW